MGGGTVHVVPLLWESRRAGAYKVFVNEYQSKVLSFGAWIIKNGLQAWEPRPSVRLG